MQITKKETLNILANVEIIANNVETGEIIHQEKQHNLVANDGLNLIRDLLKKENAGLSHFAVGSDDTATTSDMSALGNEVYRQQITAMTSESQRLVVRYFLASNEANGNNLYEAGIFNDDTAGDMFARVTHGLIEKNESVSVTYIWTVNLVAVE